MLRVFRLIAIWFLAYVAMQGVYALHSKSRFEDATPELSFAIVCIGVGLSSAIVHAVELFRGSVRLANPRERLLLAGELVLIAFAVATFYV